MLARARRLAAAAVLAGDAATTEQIALIRQNLGLDRSIPEQYLIWASQLLRGNLGESYYYKMAVTTLIGQRLEPTLSLSALTIVIAVRGGALAAQARADHAGVGDLGGEELDGADGVVVAGDDVVDEVGIAVRVGDQIGRAHV